LKPPRVPRNRPGPVVSPAAGIRLQPPPLAPAPGLPGKGKNS